MLVRLLLHWVILALALYLASLVPIGISFDSYAALGWAALALIIANAILKPLLVIVTLPLVILTLGLFLFVINALILYWLPAFVPGFHVGGFGAAFLGSILLSLITGLFSGLEKAV